MKTNIESYIAAIINDNRDYITGTVADYLIDNLNQESDYAEYFELSEIEFGVSNEQQQELRDFIEKNYNYAL